MEHREVRMQYMKAQLLENAEKVRVLRNLQTDQKVSFFEALAIYLAQGFLPEAPPSESHSFDYSYHIRRAA